MTTTRRHIPWLAIVAVGCLVASACSNSSGGNGDAREESEAVTVDAPGVTEDEIRVGGVASVTNPLSGKYDQQFAGVEAYFQMVNEDGGVHGRELKLVAKHDDQLSRNVEAVQELLTRDDVFAVLPVASLLFTGADRLVEAKVPTFGWAINPEWGGTAEEPKENMFGQAGSYLCFDCGSPLPTFVAQQVGATRVGLLAYSVPQSANCATGMERGLEQYAEGELSAPAFVDKSLGYGTTDLSVQVSQMKDAGVQLVLTCMDFQGVVTLAKEMNRQSLDAVQYLPNAYDPELLTEFGDLFQGSYVFTFFAPFEMEDPPEGLQTYLEWMEKTDTPTNENTMNGWLNAALFVEGLREAGRDFSRQKVVDAINGMTDWDADGLLAGVDWTTAHTAPSESSCGAFSRIEGEEFVPAFGEPGKPFVCFDNESADATADPTITE